MIQFIADNYQKIGTFISLFALILSLRAFYEGKKQYKDNHQAKIIFNIIQENQHLYLYVQNLGQVTAYNAVISLSHNIENPARNLHVIPPGTTYRYVLMDSSQVSDYPDLHTLKIVAQYKDVYCNQTSYRESVIEFPVLELLKYTCSWNDTQHCFDINRI